MRISLNLMVPTLALSAAFLLPLPASADVIVTVDPDDLVNGYMNVFELPANGGGFVFGNGWGTADLAASFSGDVLTLSPNTIGDPDPFWYIGGGAPGNPGNKIMEASLYNETTGIYVGETVTFTGIVLDETLTSAHTVVAFIKDFAPDYSSFEVSSVPLTPGVFSVDLPTINDPTRHVQYGFIMTGENVWVTDVAPFGTAVVTAIPEPSTLLLCGIGALAVIRRIRRPGTV